MSLLATVNPENATGNVANVYQEMTAAFGGVPNVFQIQSTSPALLQSQWNMIGFYMNHPTLKSDLLALIRMFVSQEHQCEYCIGFNAGMLINHFQYSPEQIQAAQQDPNAAPLDDKDKAMLLFVLKAVKDPHSTDKSDIDALKAQGWSDQDIYEGVAHGSMSMHMDTLFNTFKLEIDY